MDRLTRDECRRAAQACRVAQDEAADSAQKQTGTSRQTFEEEARRYRDLGKKFEEVAKRR